MHKAIGLFLVIYSYSSTILISSDSSSSLRKRQRCLPTQEYGRSLPSSGIIDTSKSSDLHNRIFQNPDIAAQILEYYVNTAIEKRNIVTAAQHGDFKKLHESATILRHYEKIVLHNRENFIQNYRTHQTGGTLLHIATPYRPIFNSPQIKDIYEKKRFFTHRRLLSYGCNVNAVDEIGMTPLHSAACNKNLIASCRLFLKCGAHTEIKTRALGRTPLLIAADFNNIAAVKLLMCAGAHIKAVDRDHNSVMHLSVIERDDRSEMLETLVFLGADIHRKNGEGLTPFQLLKRLHPKKYLPARDKKIIQSVEETLRNLGATE